MAILLNENCRPICRKIKRDICMIMLENLLYKIHIFTGELSVIWKKVIAEAEDH
jgi:hypothetical protein